MKTFTILVLLCFVVPRRTGIKTQKTKSLARTQWSDFTIKYVELTFLGLKVTGTVRPHKDSYVIQHTYKHILGLEFNLDKSLNEIEEIKEGGWDKFLNMFGRLTREEKIEKIKNYFGDFKANKNIIINLLRFSEFKKTSEKLGPLTKTGIVSITVSTEIESNKFSSEALPMEIIFKSPPENFNVSLEKFRKEAVTSVITKKEDIQTHLPKNYIITTSKYQSKHLFHDLLKIQLRSKPENSKIEFDTNGYPLDANQEKQGKMRHDFQEADLIHNNNELSLDTLKDYVAGTKFSEEMSLLHTLPNLKEVEITIKEDRILKEKIFENTKSLDEILPSKWLKKKAGI